MAFPNGITRLKPNEMIGRDKRGGSPPLRIAMLCIHSSPMGPLGTRDTGGMSVYVRELSRWLGTRGHAVDIFTCAGVGSPQRMKCPNVRLVPLNARLPANPSQDQWPALLPRVFHALDAYRRRRGIGYDLIHSHYWISGVVGSIAQTRWQRPHVTMFHTLGAVKNAACSGENESAARIAHEHWLAASVDRIVVPVAREMENLLAFYHTHRTKISVIPCGVNLELFRPLDRATVRRDLGVAPDADVALYVGRFAPLKGVDRLLGAMTHLRRRFPRLQLLIVGGDGLDTASHRALEAQVVRMGLKHKVRFVGRVAQNALPPYYSAADVLALTSHYESFGLVLLEALACGLPVVATPVGAAENLIHEGINGAIAQESSALAVADAMGHVLGGPAGQRLCRKKIRSSAKDFGWPRIGSAMEAVYLSMLDAHNPTRALPMAAP